MQRIWAMTWRPRMHVECGSKNHRVYFWQPKEAQTTCKYKSTCSSRKYKLIGSLQQYCNSYRSQNNLQHCYMHSQLYISQYVFGTGYEPRSKSESVVRAYKLGSRQNPFKCIPRNNLRTCYDSYQLPLYPYCFLNMYITKVPCRLNQNSSPFFAYMSYGEMNVVGV